MKSTHPVRWYCSSRVNLGATSFLGLCSDIARSAEYPFRKTSFWTGTPQRLLRKMTELDELLESLGLIDEENEVRRSMKQLWTRPPIEFGPDATTARKMLFWPTDGAEYARLATTTKRALAMMYAVHINNTDVKFWTGFIRSDGLKILGEKFLAEDLYERAHAVEIFLRLSAHDDLPWYDAINAENKDLHGAMLGLPLENLIANKNDSYPGGEKSCLQGLAFWLSWARHEHADGGRNFRVSRSLMTSIADWVGLAAERGDADESDLAQQLFDDFSRHPFHDGLGLVSGCFGLFENDVIEADDEQGFDISSSSEDQGGVGEEKQIIQEEEEEPQRYPPAPPTQKPPRSIRERGNKAFADGDFGTAIRAYTAALDECNDDQRAVLLCNRATCYLRVSESEMARADCEAAIDCDPENAKAKYRYAQTLSKLGEYRLASRAALEALELLADAPPADRVQTERLVVDLAQKFSASTTSSAAEKRRANLVAQLANRARRGTTEKKASSPPVVAVDQEEDEVPVETLVTTEKPEVDDDDGPDSDDDEAIAQKMETPAPPIVFPPSRTTKKLLATSFSDNKMKKTTKPTKKTKLTAAERANRILAKHCYTTAS